MEFKLDCSELPYDVLIALPGFQDDHFKLIEQAFPVRIKMQSSLITLESSQEIVFHQVEGVLDAMVQKIAKDGAIENDEIERLCYLASRGHDLSDEFSDEKPVVKTKSGKVIFAKTANQKRLVHAFRNEKIIFASGVAGTGKTYLAVAYAVDQLKRGKIEKIILTRPAVEAGESLGFLPGDMKEKVDPYLRPLYDALNEMLGQETVERYQEKEIIEIAPLAFMRGRTLNDAIVILDEAQNTTKSQMKMFLTRMGRNCRMIINGDITQIDLIRKADSGLIHACHILQGIDGIAIQYLDQSDVVRNPLVQKIIERYEQVDQS
ncbi:MAG: PhoH family protein [Erysipelotrichaceae bacterium]|nr:PhoH family protein [Erysipelotrichaceae bacterium]